MEIKREIDLNCDMGESFGPYQYGSDKEIMPFISSANVACGFHAGDPRVIRETVQLAVEHDVRIGAHIGFPDRLGFGRRYLDVSPIEVYDYTLYQLGALDAFLRAEDIPMSHIKLHGALYMMANERKQLAEATVKAVLSYNPSLEIFAMPDSELIRSGIAANLTVMNEYFADRPYNEQGVKMFGWTLDEIGSPSDIAERTLKVLNNNTENYPEKSLPSIVDTICVHSDTPGAPLIMRSIREHLEQAGWAIKGKKYLTL